MSRLIDANNAISVLKILSDKCCDDKSFEQAISVLESAPTIDAVPVVRCKECKFKPHWDEKTESAVFPIQDRFPCECDDYFYSWVPNDEWFCADGERKEQSDG